MTRVVDAQSARPSSRWNILPAYGLPVSRPTICKTSLPTSVLGDITNSGISARGSKSSTFVTSQQVPVPASQLSEAAPVSGGVAAGSLASGTASICRLTSLPADALSRSLTVSGRACASSFVCSERRAEVIVVNTDDCMDVPAEDDAIQVQDPQHVAEYVDDIFAHFYNSESRFQPRPDSIDAQTDVNSRMRGILVDWLVQVHMKYKLKPETLFMSVNLVDRFLEHAMVSRKQLQLVGVTAMLISAKFEEIYPPEIRDFVYITDNAYTKQEIQRMEVRMLSVLNFELCCPTVAHYLESYQSATKRKAEHVHLMRYVAELCLPEAKMLAYTPSHTAAAAALLSNKLMKHHPAWPEDMTHIPRQDEAVVKACARDMCGLLENAESSQLQAVRRKYSQPSFSSIAKLTW
eukprot:TRINITY_DN103226_c0_g1_i1.p1 TRINITY_DN103226_c0_g1~~TRINITY_DN103226_c0_g1_i1.p1  ORF type:complete len:406 (-),score=63.31 TRINITY_DN103226_c0_g1_i1:121-1338(-)